MLKKCLLLFLLIIFMLPVCAGEVEEALKNGKNVFLYLYTTDCSYCKKFSPTYDYASKTYNNKFTFVKVDANTPYGHKLMRTYTGRYVPYVVLLKPNDGMIIPPSCLADKACIDLMSKKF